MTKLEHLNLVISDMDETLRFYQAAFPHWSIRGEGRNTWHGKPRRWLHFGDDYQYLAFSDHGEGKLTDNLRMNVGMSHFAYTVSNIDAVIKRLFDAGYDIDQQGNGDDIRQNVYFKDPTGFEIEFVQYSSDLPEQRNQYD